MRSLSIAVLSLSTIYFLPHIGDFNGDIISVIPMLYAIWLLVKFSRTGGLNNLMLAGSLAGLSLALKLTNVIFAPFFAAFILLWLVRRQIKAVLVVTASTILSFAVVILPRLGVPIDMTVSKSPLIKMLKLIVLSLMLMSLN
jgi:uncharacterized membrane protein